MKRIEITRLLFLSALGILILGLQACSKDTDQQELALDARLTQAEFQAVMGIDEWTGAVDAALAEIYRAGYGLSAKTAIDGCYEATFTETGFTATFKNCMLNTTEYVNGTLVVVYDPESATAGFTAIFDGFFVGDTELNGSRTFTLGGGSQAGSIVFAVSSDMTVALNDGSLITESGSKTVETILGETLSKSGYSVDGTWSLTIGDKAYLLDVTSPLTFNFSCAYLVSGTLEISRDGLVFGVDFGDGNCDNQVIITYPDGAKEELEL